MNGFYLVGGSDGSAAAVLYGKGIGFAPLISDDLLLGKDMFNLLHPLNKLSGSFFSNISMEGDCLVPVTDIEVKVSWLIWDERLARGRRWGDVD